MGSDLAYAACCAAEQIKEMSIYAEIKYKDSLKHQGHDLIDELVELGIKKDRIYKNMAKRLRVPLEQAHFSNVDKIERLEIMVRMLTSYRDHILARRPTIKVYLVKKKKKKHTSIVATAKPDPPKIPGPQGKHETYESRRENMLSREDMLKALEQLKDPVTIPQKSLWKRVLSHIRMIK